MPRNEYFLIDGKRGIRRAISALRMRRLDSRSVPQAPDELRLILVVRNEMLRLPYFYSYYRSLGVGRFFVVDNASTDGTEEWLLDQADTHVFSTCESYIRQESWVDGLLRRYGVRRWCVVVDVDELLVYPGQDRMNLSAFCGELDKHGWNTMHAVLLDMYPDKPLIDAEYKAGEPFLPSAPFFEHTTLRRHKYPFRNCAPTLECRYDGGVRQRVFSLDDICCSKFPLFRWQPGMFLRQGTHSVEGAAIADAQSALLHFKFLNDFGSRVQYEAKRGEHWNGASQYKAYADKVSADARISFWGAQSLRYEGPRQLQQLGLLRSIPELDAIA